MGICFYYIEIKNYEVYFIFLVSYFIIYVIFKIIQKII